MPDETRHESADLDDFQVDDSTDTLSGAPGDDPLDRGVAPPERWSAGIRYGTTAGEQEAGESLDQQLAEEEPDVTLDYEDDEDDEDEDDGGRRRRGRRRPAARRRPRPAGRAAGRRGRGRAPGRGGGPGRLRRRDLRRRRHRRGSRHARRRGRRLRHPVGQLTRPYRTWPSRVGQVFEGGRTIQLGAGRHRYRGTALVRPYGSGVSQMTPSGGRVMVAEAGRPCQGSATASMAPRLPTPLPP